MLTGLLLDGSRFSDVTVTNGRVVNDGSHIVVVGMALPGLQENLQIDAEKLELPESVAAPVAQGQRIGTLKVMLSGEAFREVPLLAGSSVESANFGGILLHLFRGFVGLG